MVVGPSSLIRAESLCSFVLGQLRGTAEQSNSAGKRKESPSQSAESTGKVNSEAPGWTRRFSDGMVLIFASNVTYFLCMLMDA